MVYLVGIRCHFRGTHMVLAKFHSTRTGNKIVCNAWRYLHDYTRDLDLD
jgi:hypothetical protein